MTADTNSAAAPIMWFRTLGGATVTVQPHSYTNWEGKVREGFAWACRGCDQAGGSTRWVEGALNDVRDAANTHAGQCRSMPKPVASKRRRGR